MGLQGCFLSQPGFLIPLRCETSEAGPKVERLRLLPSQQLVEVWSQYSEHVGCISGGGDLVRCYRVAQAF